MTTYTKTKELPINEAHISGQHRQEIARTNTDLRGVIAALVANSSVSTATLDLTTDIVLSSVAESPALNGLDVTLIVAAAADNTPASTVLISTALVDNDLTITVTPDSDPVVLTTAQLVLAINGSVTGTYDSIPVAITDTGGYLALMSATGGDATALAASGEGDDGTCSFWGGA